MSCSDQVILERCRALHSRLTHNFIRDAKYAHILFDCVDFVLVQEKFYTDLFDLTAMLSLDI